MVAYGFMKSKIHDSPSLITVWKRLLVNAKVKAIMQCYDNLVACFENKWT